MPLAPPCAISAGAPWNPSSGPRHQRWNTHENTSVGHDQTIISQGVTGIPGSCFNFLLPLLFMKDLKHFRSKVCLVLKGSEGFKTEERKCGD